MVRAAIHWSADTPVGVVEIAPGPLGPRDVRVRVDASGVCHTDLTISRRHPATPTIVGHEGAGTVVECGTDVTGLDVGQRVIASFAPACRYCFHCVRGESTQCEETARSFAVPRGQTGGVDVIAMAGLGTWSEEMTVSEMQLVPVDTDLPAEQLALIGCGVTTGVGAALWSARVHPGATVTIFGCGGVGLFAVQGARIASASQVIAVDPLESKRNAAAAAGATDLIDPTEGDPVEQVRALTSGRGTDYAFEIVGKPSTMVQAYHSARPRGVAVIVGMPATDAALTLPAADLFRSERRIVGSFYGSAQVMRDMPILVGLAETGALDIESVVSRRIGLDEIGDALRALDNGDALRSVIVPGI